MNEHARIEALHRLAVLDSLPEPVFDALTACAAKVCQVPIALVSLVDMERQWFKSNIGLPGVEETPRDVAFCDHAIRGDSLFEIGDAQLDERFAANPYVTGDPHVRFYAGAPIVMPGGERIGTVCVIDHEPRRLSEEQRSMLESLGRIASAALTERSRHVAITQQLAISEARYRTIVEDQSELVSLARPDGTLTFVNMAYARHFGTRPEQLVGRTLFDLVAIGDRAAVEAHWESVCAQRGAVSGLNRMQSAQGRMRWVAWTNRPIEDATGAIVSVQSVGRDITHQRLAEEALAESERRFRSLYESTPAMLHSIDAKGLIIGVSDLWLQVMGYQRAEVIGRTSTSFLTPESARYAMEEVLPAFHRDGRCDRIEYQFVRRDGTIIDALLSAMLERDEDGWPVRSLAVWEDVTAARRMAAELGHTHARLDAIVENVPALLGHWDRAGITQFANREFQAAIGLPQEQIIGCSLKAVLDSVDPLAHAEVAPHLHAVLQGRREQFEMSMLTTLGLRQLRVTFVPDQPQAGQVVGFYGMAHDVTGQKALELRLSDSEQRYRSLFDNLNSGFALHEIVLDGAGKPVDYRFLAMNAAFTAMTGLEPAQALGRRVTEVLPGTESDLAEWIGRFGRVVLSGLPDHFEQRSADLDRWFEVVAYRASEGQFAVIVRDITQHKHTEARLRSALDRSGAQRSTESV